VVRNPWAQRSALVSMPSSRRRLLSVLFDSGASFEQENAYRHCLSLPTCEYQNGSETVWIIPDRLTMRKVSTRRSRGPVEKTRIRISVRTGRPHRQRSLRMPRLASHGGQMVYERAERRAPRFFKVAALPTSPVPGHMHILDLERYAADRGWGAISRSPGERLHARRCFCASRSSHRSASRRSALPR
jgi:hypothetical protein